MRKSLLAVVVSAAAAMLAVVAPSTAKADLPLLGATFNVASLGRVGARNPAWAVVTRFDLGFQAAADETATGRRSYEVLASLPTTESAVRTYDVKPVVDSVTNQKVKLGSDVTLTLISGKNLLVADVGSTKVSLTPTSFGSGVLTIGGAF